MPHAFRRHWVSVLLVAWVGLSLAPAAAAATYYDLLLSHNPVAYWRLGESGGATAVDEQGLYSGVYQGPTLGQAGALKGDHDTAIQLDGVNDYVSASTPTVSGSALTLVAWIKPTGPNTAIGGVIAKRRIWTALLVVANTGSLTSDESARRALLESWGYQVNLIAASAPSAAYNAATMTAHVAYVPCSISDSQLNTKLKTASIGVVNENWDLVDDFGFAQNSLVAKTSDEVRIISNAHYITSGLTNGSLLSITTSSQNLFILNGGIASGANELAETFSHGVHYRTSLLALEAGAALYGGGTAAGRRVLMPWGASAFNFSALNSNGQLQLRRAIDWAAGYTSSANDEAQHRWTLRAGTSSGELALEWRLRAGGATTLLSTNAGAIEPDTWYLVTAVYDGSAMKLYLNENEVGSRNKTGALDSTSQVPVWLGNVPARSSAAPWGNAYAGHLDEVAIFNKALTPEEILALHRSGQPRGVRILRWQELP